MEIIGRQIELGVALEETRGTAQTVAEKWIKNVSANITERAEVAVDDNSHGNLFDSDNQRLTRKFVEGSLEGVLQVDVVGYVLYNIFGSVVSTEIGTGDNVYSHEMTLNSNSIEHDSLTLFAKDGGIQNLNIANAMVSSLEISFGTDDFVRYSANFLATKAEDGTDAPAYEKEFDFVGKDITIKVADTEGGLDSAEAVPVKEGSITLDTGAIIDYVLGKYEADNVYNAKLAVEGSLSKNFKDETYKDLYLNQTAKYMEINIKSTEDIGGGNNPEINIVMNKVKLTNWNREAGGNDELVPENIEFKAFYNEDDDEGAKITIVNNTSEYNVAPTT